MAAKRILSVSFEPSLLMRRELLLRGAGYEVASALSLIEAKHLCGSRRFDLAIIGHAMPRRDKQFFVQLAHETCSIPVLVLMRPGEEPIDAAEAMIDATATDATLLETVQRVANGSPKHN
jgi:DNA-binding response OmpR family regulator